MKSIFLNRNINVLTIYKRNLSNGSKYLLSNSSNNDKSDDMNIKTDKTFDILICGGGMVGNAMALALKSDSIFKDLKIGLIESAKRPINSYKMPQIHSNRVCALSGKTIEFFKGKTTSQLFI
jgi:hypothetical protein